MYTVLVVCLALVISLCYNYLDQSINIYNKTYGNLRCPDSLISCHLDKQGYASFVRLLGNADNNYQSLRNYSDILAGFKTSIRSKIKAKTPYASIFHDNEYTTSSRQMWTKWFTSERYNWTTGKLFEKLQSESAPSILPKVFLRSVITQRIAGKHLPVIADANEDLLRILYPSVDRESTQDIRELCRSIFIFGELNGASYVPKMIGGLNKIIKKNCILSSIVIILLFVFCYIFNSLIKCIIDFIYSRPNTQRLHELERSVISEMLVRMMDRGQTRMPMLSDNTHPPCQCDQDIRRRARDLPTLIPRLRINRHFERLPINRTTPNKQDSIPKLSIKSETGAPIDASNNDIAPCSTNTISDSTSSTKYNSATLTTYVRSPTTPVILSTKHIDTKINPETSGQKIETPITNNNIQNN